jgi:hypothetical protein
MLHDRFHCDECFAWVRSRDNLALEEDRLRGEVIRAIMEYTRPGSPETFRSTEAACKALREFESNLPRTRTRDEDGALLVKNLF